MQCYMKAELPYLQFTSLQHFSEVSICGFMALVNVVTADNFEFANSFMMFQFHLVMFQHKVGNFMSNFLKIIKRKLLSLEFCCNFFLSDFQEN